MITEEFLTRTEMLLGEKELDQLERSAVAVFGIGGVGGYAAEALVRCGIKTLHFIDMDVVDPSNINRQIIADYYSIGQHKSDLMKERALRINPKAKVYSHPIRFSEETVGLFDFTSFDYVVDAIDQVPAKVSLIIHAKEQGIRIISSMGAGNKLDPTRFEVADIYRTSVCPLARIMRRELRSRNIDSLKVVYSKERPRRTLNREEPSIVGSVSFVPPVAGLILAGEVINDLIATV
jgi:tRNA threonylcarbamoyladenosine dehydratase